MKRPGGTNRPGGQIDLYLEFSLARVTAPRPICYRPRMRFCYADPPYPRQAKRHYAADPKCAEVDPVALMAQMDAQYDAWALSTSEPALRDILHRSPEGARVLAWVKPFAIFKPGVRLAYTWEPVIAKGWRKGTRADPTVRDHVSANITLKRGLCGVKPDKFSFWLFDAMGLRPDDELVDLFPGSGAVTRAWAEWSANFPSRA